VGAGGREHALAEKLVASPSVTALVVPGRRVCVCVCLCVCVCVCVCVLACLCWIAVCERERGHCHTLSLSDVHRRFLYATLSLSLSLSDVHRHFLHRQLDGRVVPSQGGQCACEPSAIHRGPRRPCPRAPSTPHAPFTTLTLNVLQREREREREREGLTHRHAHTHAHMHADTDMYTDTRRQTYVTPYCSPCDPH
jgi:hypothetical protein